MDLTTQNIFTNFKDVVKVKDLQKMLGIGRNLAYELISTNQIKSIKSGNLILIRLPPQRESLPPLIPPSSSWL